MEYKYTAIDAQGSPVQGVISADSELDAIKKIRNFDMTPVELSDNAESSVGVRKKRKADKREWLSVIEELTSLLEAKVTLIDAITAITESTHSLEIIDTFKDLQSRLSQGETFSEALQLVKTPLPDHFFAMIKAGENTGDLAESMRQGLDKMAYDDKVASELKTALIYPSVLVGSGILAVVIIFTVVIPKFAKFAEGKYDSLPFLSQLVMKSGLWFNENLVIIGVVAAVCMASIIAIVKTKRFAIRAFQMAARVPMLGEWIIERESANWTTSMAGLLKSHVNLIHALTLTMENTRLPSWKAQMKQVLIDMENGINLATSIRNNHLLTSLAYNMISVGEQTGKMADMFQILANVYSKRASQRTTRLMTLVEPIAILLIGGIIAILVLGIVMTITSVNQFAT